MNWLDTPESPDTNILQEVTASRVEDKELIRELAIEVRRLREELGNEMLDGDALERLIPVIRESLESPISMTLINRELAVGNAKAIAHLLIFWVARAGLELREWK